MKLFIFDMGGVVAAGVAVTPAIAAELGISDDDFFRGAGSDPDAKHTSPYHLGDIAAIMSGTISVEQFWKRFSERTGIAVSGDPWYSHFHPSRDEKTVQLIKDLQKKGHRVVCGTNTLESHFRRHTELGDYACFDKVYASQQMGVIKPDRGFWDYILKEEKTDAADAFFTDDFEENIEAARRIGLKAHHFTGADDLRLALKSYLS
ncbi:HAD-IA family hydrolase [Treponema sp. OttesenSCG-928-L16]|nr:HAD-IA family hydrolase [Treponema sp. OttesenSCG-928-L16]